MRLQTEFYPSFTIVSQIWDKKSSPEAVRGIINEKILINQNFFKSQNMHRRENQSWLVFTWKRKNNNKKSVFVTFKLLLRTLQKVGDVEIFSLKSLGEKWTFLSSEIYLCF